MGTHDTTYAIETTRPLAEVYQKWTDSIRREYGTSHSVSEGVEELTYTTRTPERAADIVFKALNERTSWSSGVAVPIFAEKDIERRTITVRGTILGTAWSRDYDAQEKALRALVKEKARGRAGERIDNVRIASRTVTQSLPNGRTYERQVEDVTVHTKVVATAPKEKTVTRYYVHPVGQAPNPARDVGHPAQAAARAALVARLEADTSQFGVQMEVSALTRRESGAGLVVAERQVVKVEVAVEAEISRVKPGAEQGGWYMGCLIHG